MSESSVDDDSGGLIPEDLICEILIWVPVKSLMRFKCVSRRWISFIQNPVFAREYRGSFKGLLLSKPYYWGESILETTRDFFYLNLLGEDVKDCDDSPTISHHHTVNHGGGKKMAATAPVNALVCFYCGSHSYLYNIATRESMVLPVSVHESGSCTYHLGCDPSKKLYKLLKICPLYKQYDEEGQAGYNFLHNLSCEILTIGIDSSWRSIDPGPWEKKYKSLCINGVLYWAYPDEPSTGIPRHIISFDLAQEKYQFISEPEVDSHLVWFGPSLAITSRSSFPQFKQISILYYDGHDNHSCSGDGELLSRGLWTEHKVILPESEDHYDLTAVGVLPNGKVLILERPSFWTFPVPFYLYDRTKRELQKIAVSKSPSSSRLYDGSASVYVSYHEENIIPLSCLGSQY